MAELLKEALSLNFEIQWYGSPDKRSYRVNFDKIRNVLGFSPSYTTKEGAREIYEATEKGIVTDSLKTKTVEWYKHLLEMHKLMREVLLKDTIL